jgi:hypothetical protein
MLLSAAALPASLLLASRNLQPFVRTSVCGTGIIHSLGAGAGARDEDELRCTGQL